MKLSELLQDISCKTAVPDCEITAVTCDSRKAGPGVLFACLKGVQADGHDFAQAAVQAGSPVVLVQRDLGLPQQVLVDDSRYAFSKVCANKWGNPARRLKFIGVTGTNGKTTVTKVVKNVLTIAGYKVGLIGTIQNEVGDQALPTGKTTPDPEEYQQLIARMADAACDYVVMEVSSHALDQHRMADTHYEVGVFTNLTQDHLDYHGTMENYYQAKRKLFDVSDKAVVCVDDQYGRRLAGEVPCSALTFSATGQEANFAAADIHTDVNGVSFLLRSKGVAQPLHFGTPGMFSVHNAMAAALVCLSLGLPVEKIAEAVAACPPVKGRSERIPTGRDFTVICDYAHSPDGLQNILDSVNGYKTGRVVTLFGCGGDRDRTKRPIMGEVAARNSDFLVVTSDNPRTEDPDAIIDEIIPGVERTDTPYIRITDRREAIHYAVKNARPGDIVLLAGKGHEDYQVLGTQKVHFDEREVVADALKKI